MAPMSDVGASYVLAVLITYKLRIQLVERTIAVCATNRLTHALLAFQAHLVPAGYRLSF